MMKSKRSSTGLDLQSTHHRKMIPVLEIIKFDLHGLLQESRSSKSSLLAQASILILQRVISNILQRPSDHGDIQSRHVWVIYHLTIS